MMKRILVPVDFSPPSLQALDYAIEFGRPFKAEFIILNVFDPIYPMAGNMYAPVYSLDLVSQDLQRSAREHLARLGTQLQKRHLTVRTLLGVGAPYSVIVDTAKKLKADLIIMSTHGRTGLSHMFIGSVAERVVRSATCPVLTVRAEKPRRRSSVRRHGPSRRRTRRSATRSRKAASA